MHIGGITFDVREPKGAAMLKDGGRVKGKEETPALGSMTLTGHTREREG